MSIRVFVSHQEQDSMTASLVSVSLLINDLKSYLDVVDDALTKDGPELADHIRSRMNDCDQLMAVVSKNTKSSWWVPWEIGVASEKNFRIATYTAESLNYLPI